MSCLIFIYINSSLKFILILIVIVLHNEILSYNELFTMVPTKTLF